MASASLVSRITNLKVSQAKNTRLSSRSINTTIPKHSKVIGCSRLTLAPKSNAGNFPTSTTETGTNVTPVVEPADTVEEDKVGTFQWTKNWYPIHVVDQLDATRPHKVTLLGIEMVIWNDGEKWNVFEDKCPHRLVPLSEGRVEDDGTLLCSYHAWRFDSQGTCTKIPQAKEGSGVVSNPRACATAYPTREDEGLLWVWPESGADGLLSSLSKEPDYLNPRLKDDQGREMEVAKFPWGFRDLKYGWEMFMENTNDPAHVPVSHHGLVGDRYEDAVPIAMPTSRKYSDNEGFKVHSADFRPPAMLTTGADTNENGDRIGMIFELHAVPTTPGKCRHIGRNVYVKYKDEEDAAGSFMFTGPISKVKWLLHLLAPLFLNQDMVYLHHQEYFLKTRKGEWKDECYLGIESDKGTIFFRKWLQRNGEKDVYGKYSVPWKSISNTSSALPPKPKEEELFDTYNSHVKHCTHCQGALKNFKRTKLAAICAAVVFALKAFSGLVTHQVAPLAIGAGFREKLMHSVGSIASPSTWFFLALGATATLVAVAAHKMMKLFFIYRFAHQDNP